MRLHTRFRVSLALSAAVAGAMALLTAWTLLQARRAAEWSDLASGLRRQVLERTALRDEYLLHRSVRAQRQYEERTGELLRTVAQVAAFQDTPEERQAVEEMGREVEQGRTLFARLASLPDERGLPAEERELARERRDQVVSSIVLLAYELSSKASDLEDHAAREELRTRRLAFLSTLAAMAVVLAITLLHAGATSGLLQRRIALLQAGAARLAGGDLSARLELPGDDELAELGRAFDRMAARLEEGQAELRREVAERQLANAQLLAANQELEAFSYSVSHDLRAPLRHVTGFVELLVKHSGGALDEKGRHYAEVISGAARRMGALIDDLLGFSRIGRAELRLRRVGLRPLVDEARAEVAAGLDGRQVAWEIGPLPEVEVDAALLRQVWVNLLSNAAKFTRQQAEARIEVGAEAGAGEVRCWVRDNGAGFDMRYADKLFGVFQRLHAPDRFEGTGIGLANVKRIVTRHGGRVWAEGMPGAGATFWFSLPERGDVT